MDRWEITELKRFGYEYKDPFEIVGLFEREIAAYTSAPYAVAVDSCTHAVELCLRYLRASGIITVPKHTYLSIPMTVKKLGCEVAWSDQSWHGVYSLNPFPVVDASLRFRPDMYSAGTFTCLSFQVKKRLGIGRGGMILLDDSKAYSWLQRARYDGRNWNEPWKAQQIHVLGYHYYMTPEDAARGLIAFDKLDPHNQVFEDLGGAADYPDISRLPVFQAGREPGGEL